MGALVHVASCTDKAAALEGPRPALDEEARPEPDDVIFFSEQHGNWIIRPGIKLILKIIFLAPACPRRAWPSRAAPAFARTRLAAEESFPWHRHFGPSPAFLT